MDRLSFVGDLMFGDMPVTFGYGVDSMHHGTQYESVFELVKSDLHKSKFVVGNFESIIRPRPSAATVSNWATCCDPVIARRLHEANVRIVSLANNHSMDYGVAGYESTRDALSSAGITTIGDIERPWTTLDLNGERVGLAAASYVRENARSIRYLHSPDQDTWKRILGDMKGAGATRFVAYLHWGNEFVSKPVPEQQEAARVLQACGFDLVVGAHSHVLQAAERIEEMPVMYGLGNFVSDYWQPRLRRTAILDVFWSGGKGMLEVRWCEISSDARPAVTGAQQLDIQESAATASAADVSRARWRIRYEYLAQIVKNFHRINGKAAMLSWLGRRIVYVARYGFSELTDPNILYEKYKS